MPPAIFNLRTGEASRPTFSFGGADSRESAVGTPRSEATDSSDEIERDLGDARRDARVPVGVTAHSFTDHNEVIGTLRNLSLGGALLVTPGPVAPATGTGLEVAFRLPTGPQLRLSSSVRWSRTDDPEAHSSSGIQFLNVSGPNRSYLEHYIELVAANGSDDPVRTEVLPKYRISFDAAGRVQAMLGGMLTRDEAHAFASLLKQRMSARKMSRMHFAFDVRRLSVCNQDVIQELKGCFDLFAQHPEIFGFLIGNKSLALTQLVRAARDAGIADHVFCVNESEDAYRIWDQMEG